MLKTHLEQLVDDYHIYVNGKSVQCTHCGHSMSFLGKWKLDKKFLWRCMQCYGDYVMDIGEIKKYVSKVGWRFVSNH